jgi:hypothetical protein
MQPGAQGAQATKAIEVAGEAKRGATIPYGLARSVHRVRVLGVSHWGTGNLVRHTSEQQSWMSLSTRAQDPSIGNDTHMTRVSAAQNGSSGPASSESGLPLSYPGRQGQFHARSLEGTL